MILFASFISSLKPIIIIPPLYGSNLWANSSYHYINKNCRTSFDDAKLWVDPTYYFPPDFTCTLKSLATFPGPNGTIRNYPNISIYTKDFGGSESTSYVASIKRFKTMFVVSMGKTIAYFSKKGYILKHNLFITPYDWRIAPTYTDDFWPKLKHLVEQAYDINKKKVTLFGFSLGGFMVQQFLGEKASEEWKQKYIQQVIMLAPSFAGAGGNFHHMWVQRSPLAPKLNNAGLKLLLESWPVIHVHNPNQKVYGNQTLVIGPDGKEYSSYDLFDLLKNHSRISHGSAKLYEKSLKIIEKEPKQTGVKTTILYNSGIRTIKILNFTKGWNKSPEKIYKGGDGTLLAEQMIWTCNNWANTTCYDFHQKGKSYSHQPLISNKNVLEKIFKLTNTNETEIAPIPDLSNVTLDEVGNKYYSEANYKKDIPQFFEEPNAPRSNNREKQTDL